MVEIRYEQIDLNLFKSYELLRMKAYKKEKLEESISNNYFIKLMLGKMMIVGLYLDNVLVGGLYLSLNRDYLFVDQLFIDCKYHNSGLRLGRYLLNNTIINKDMIINYFNKDYNSVKLIGYDDKSKSIYKSIGFDYENNGIMLVKRIF